MLVPPSRYAPLRFSEGAVPFFLLALASCLVGILEGGCQSPYRNLEEVLAIAAAGLKVSALLNRNKVYDVQQISCTPHSILEIAISKVIVDDIRAKARLAVEDEDALREAVRKRRQATADEESQHNIKELREGEKRLAQLETLISKTYEEKLLGAVPEELCVKMLNQYLDEQKVLREKVTMLKEKCENAEQAERDIDKFVENIKKYINIQELTCETCLELIEYIVIGDHPESKDEDRQIHIFYKFLDNGLAEKRNILLPQNVE